ncbi:MAG: hypothetical protein ACFB10_14120 [Salibacteraceae bacterium]
MKLFYAMGGGFGHLVRTHAFIQKMGFLHFRVLTSNPLATRIFKPENLIFLLASTPQLVSMIQATVLKHAAASSEVYIDSFPQGILGELGVLAQVGKPLHYLARRLRWPAYQPMVKSTVLRYDQTFLLEELEPAHQAWLQTHSKRCLPFSITYPSPNTARVKPQIQFPQRPLWIVVHAFHSNEVQQLVNLAETDAELENQSPELLVISDQPVDLPTGARLLDDYPAHDWFPLAARIYSGCGFNSFYQLKKYRQRSILLPFDRKLDDQHWRLRSLTA